MKKAIHFWKIRVWPAVIKYPTTIFTFSSSFSELNSTASTKEKISQSVDLNSYVSSIPSEFLISKRESTDLNTYTGRSGTPLDLPETAGNISDLAGQQDWCFLAKILAGIDPFDASRWTPLSKYPYQIMREYVSAPEFSSSYTEWLLKISHTHITNNFLFLQDLDGLTFLFTLLKLYGRYGIYLPEIIIFTCLLFLFVTKLPTAKLYGRILMILYITLFMSVLSLALPFASAELFTGYKADGYSVLAKVILLFLFLGFYLGISVWEMRSSPRKESYVVTIFFLLFGLIAVTCSNFWLLFFSLEGVSFCLIIFFVFNFSGSGHISDAVRYFCLNSLASGMFLISLGIAEYVTNTANYHEFNCFFSLNPHIVYVPSSFLLAAIFFLVGSFFKLGIFPFNIYEVDTYKKSSFVVIYFASLIAKVPFFLIWLKLVWRIIPFIKTLFPIIVILALLTTIIGSVAALFQTGLRQFLAYSSMAHTGMILTSFGTETALGVNSAFLYLLSYFAAMTIIYFALNGLEGLGLDLHGVHQLRELRANTPLAVSFTLAILSLAGFPLTLGFFSKLGLMVNLVKIGQTNLFIIVLLLNILSFAYYARVIRIIWLEVNDSSALKYTLTDLQTIKEIISKHNPFYCVHLTAAILSFFSLFVLLSMKFVMALTGALWCVALYAVDWSWFIRWALLDFKLWGLYTKRDWLAANRAYYWFKQDEYERYTKQLENRIETSEETTADGYSKQPLYKAILRERIRNFTDHEKIK